MVVSEQGRKATRTGSFLEGTIAMMLDKSGFVRMDNKLDVETLIFNCPHPRWYIQQYSKFNGIYKVPIRLDFIIMHKERFPKGLAVEVKFQGVAGSVDEKYPYVVLNMQGLFTDHNIKGIILMDGAGYRKCVLEWCKEQQNDNFKVIAGTKDIYSWFDENLM